MIAAAFFFSLLGLFVKWGSSDFSSVEMLFYRTAFGACILGAWMVYRGESLKPIRVMAHARRAIIGYCSMLLLFYALTRLPLGTATVLNYTSSLIFPLLCATLAKEDLHGRAIIALVIGFAGICVLLQPSFAAETYRFAFIGLASGLCAGVALFEVRQLTQQGESPRVIVFWFFMISTLIGGLYLIYTQGFSPLIRLAHPAIVGVVMAGLLGQVLMTQAYQKGPAFLVSCCAYTCVIFSVMLGVILWHDHFHWLELTGIALIIYSGILSAKP
jgi:S-adenosylmethionine uptake transporter